MKRILLYVFLIFVASEVSAQIYAFDSIPENLRRRADAVVRSEQCLYTITNPGHAVERVKTVVTLLNDNSESYRYQSVMYNKFSKVNYLKGAIYDRNGKVIKVLGLLDVEDMSAVSGGSFYADDRMKTIYFQKYKYPYTIEFEYEVEYNSILNYPTWYFQDRPGVSVERSGIQLIVPKGIKFRYSVNNLKNDIDSVITSDLRIYTWQEENLSATLLRNYVINTLYNPAVVRIAPNDFEYGGYEGSMSSWKTFGEWFYNLNKGLDALPEEELAEVTKICAQTQDSRERSKLIYEFVQSKTRYVSIDIGIGGYRPAAASSVASNGFGDCKALTNYTFALLKAAGIKSYYAVVKSGENKNINKNFISNQFDHVILCVPMEKDTVWLECTSQTMPFNYLSSFTDNRYALLITPGGGELVKTPSFTKNENVTKRSGSVSLYAIGSSLGKISNYYSGYQYGNASLLISMKSEDELKRYLYSDLRYYDFNVLAVTYTENKSEKPTSTFSYNISVKDLTTTMGSRIYFTPAVDKAEYMQDIESDMEIANSEIMSDSISYSIPYGYKIQFLPVNVSLETEFGVFRYQLAEISDRIIYKRYLEVNKGKIPKAKFKELRSFVNSIAETDNEKIILTKVI